MRRAMKLNQVVAAGPNTALRRDVLAAVREVGMGGEFGAYRHRIEPFVLFVRNCVSRVLLSQRPAEP